MIDPKAAVTIVSLLAGASICWSAAYAWARWLARPKIVPGPAPHSAEHDERLRGIEQALDAVAIEVERIGEGQRFTARLLGERSPASAPVVRAPVEYRGVVTPL